MGQIIFTGSNGSWTQFALICQSHSTEDLYFAVGHFPLHFSLNLGISLGFYFYFFFFGPFLLCGLLGGPLSFDFYWAFGYEFAKMGINKDHSHNSLQDFLLC